MTEWLNRLPLAEGGLSVTANEKMWLAIGLFAGAVAAVFWADLSPVALGLVAWAMCWPIFCRCRRSLTTWNGRLLYSWAQ